jgi:hypothetical protein
MRGMSVGVTGLGLALLGCSSSAEPAGQAEPTTIEKTPDGPPGACPTNPADRKVRCIDEVGLEICPTKTGLPGDGLAICDSDPASSILLHYGPANYDDPEEMKPFMLGPGEEDENCTYVRTPNDAEVYIESYSGRLRPHSHHLIVTEVSEDGFTETAKPAPCNLLDVVGAKWLVGSQSPQIDVLVSGAGKDDPKGRPTDPSVPDYQLGQVLPAHTPLRVDLHYVNPTDKPLLREGWIHLTTTDKSKVSTVVDMITFFQGDISIPPRGEATTLRARCVAKSDRYVGLVTAHAHSRMTRESMWIEKPNQPDSLLYETYDWAEPGELFYRDGLQNPVPNPDSKAFGGASGYQLVKKGEAVSFECAYSNTTDQEITLGETTKQEMCNVFGMYYPTDGAAWNCACLGSGCLDKLPAGVNLFNNKMP